ILMALHNCVYLHRTLNLSLPQRGSVTAVYNRPESSIAESLSLQGALRERGDDRPPERPSRRYASAPIKYAETFYPDIQLNEAGDRKALVRSAAKAGKRYSRVRLMST